MTDAEASGRVSKIFALFPDETAAREYLERRLWPAGPVCPECANAKGITARAKAGFYRCNACKTDFTVRTNTIFGRSHIPLRKWVAAMYLFVTAKEGISSVQLATQIQVTQKTAWFMLQRLREACGSDEDIGNIRDPVGRGIGLMLSHGVHEVYRQCSDKHFDRYVDEFAFRHVNRPVFQKMDLLCGAGRRLTYKDLTA